MWFSLLRVNWVMPRTVLGLLEGNGMEVWDEKGLFRLEDVLQCLELPSGLEKLFKFAVW